MGTYATITEDKRFTWSEPSHEVFYRHVQVNVQRVDDCLRTYYLRLPISSKPSTFRVFRVQLHAASSVGSSVLPLAVAGMCSTAQECRLHVGLMMHSFSIHRVTGITQGIV